MNDLNIYSFLIDTSHKLGEVQLNLRAHINALNNNNNGVIYRCPEEEIPNELVYDKIDMLRKACIDLANINAIGIDAWLNALTKNNN